MLSIKAYALRFDEEGQWKINEPRYDKRDLLAIKVKSEIFTEKERPSCCEQIQKI